MSGVKNPNRTDCRKAQNAL